MSLLSKLIDFFLEGLSDHEEETQVYEEDFVANQYLNKLKANGFKVRVPSDRIDVLETNMNVRVPYPERNEDPIQELKRITIYYYPDIKGEKREYKETLNNVDKTIFEFKMRARGYVDLYLGGRNYNKFASDLGFINEEIQFN